MREKFKQQLEEMYRQMVIMGSLCQQAIAVAVRTLDEEEDRAELCTTSPISLFTLRI